MNKNDLRFLLKDKYGFNEIDIGKYFAGELKSKLERQIAQDTKLLSQGYPLAYVIGYVDFLECKIDLQLKPFIPRAETEYWVDIALKRLKHIQKPLEILDIFCGSGCIGISILKHVHGAHVTFADVDSQAIKQTKLNLKLNKVDSLKYTVIQSDIFSDINGHYNYIFANPPYVSTGNKTGPETKYEPQNALYAGKDGLDIIKPFLREFSKYLINGGTLYMEFNENHKQTLEIVLKGTAPAGAVPTWHKDQYKNWRWVEIRCKPAHES